MRASPLTGKTVVLFNRATQRVLSKQLIVYRSVLEKSGTAKGVEHLAKKGKTFLGYFLESIFFSSYKHGGFVSGKTWKVRERWGIEKS